MNQKDSGKTYLDDLPAEALCEGGSRIYRSTILRQGYGWQARSSASFTWRLKGYIPNDVYEKYRERYKQCIRMFNGLEKSLERHLPEQERRWAGAEVASEHGEPNTEKRTPNTEH